MFLPALCRKMGVPYCIVKNKSRLGRVCRRKTTSCLAITQVNVLSLLLSLVMIVKIRANPMILLINTRFPDSMIRLNVKFSFWATQTNISLLRLSPVTAAPSPSWSRLSRPTTTTGSTRSGSTGVVAAWATSPQPRSPSSRRLR